MPPRTAGVLRAHLAEAAAREELAEEEYRQLASRMVFLRMFMFVMIVSALTNKHPRQRAAGLGGKIDPHMLGAPVRGVWMPRSCSHDTRRWVAPVPVIYSSRQGWDRQHQELAEQASKAAEEGREARKHAIDVLWLGDGITAGWHAAGKSVWEKAVGERKHVALGIAGDQPAHLMWRLQHGELPLPDAGRATSMFSFAGVITM